jgi:hypothetical protein
MTDSPLWKFFPLISVQKSSILHVISQQAEPTRFGGRDSDSIIHCQTDRIAHSATLCWPSLPTNNLQNASDSKVASYGTEW